MTILSCIWQTVTAIISSIIFSSIVSFFNACNADHFLFMSKQEKRDHSWKWAGRWRHNCSLPCMWMPGSFLTSSFIFSSFWNQLFFPFAFHVILIKAWNNSFLQTFMINFIISSNGFLHSLFVDPYEEVSLSTILRMSCFHRIVSQSFTL